ncbi:hypothetical protein M758_12G016800 [Ceratodon purpureus]|uniref:C2H2-type domain-containing protein n=1 Tax=Ceratodon purpureus TaxID=3225 RepID=A0A8T0G309_CERPU|nr:hypothetical protein KC19_12G016200 [Ceratodon purpureus]KAG0597728.1 hypothetical protein M758_12G016800 [Ceratodon purpureus]
MILFMLLYVVSIDCQSCSNTKLTDTQRHTHTHTGEKGKARQSLIFSSAISHI